MYIPLAAESGGEDAVKKIMLQPAVRPALLALIRLSLAKAPGELPLRDELAAITTALEYLAQNYPLNRPGGPHRPDGMAAEPTPLAQTQDWSHNLLSWVAQSIQRADESNRFQLPVTLQPRNLAPEDSRQLTIAVHLVQLAAYRKRREGETAAVLRLDHSAWGVAHFLAGKYKVIPATPRFRQEAGKSSSQARLWDLLIRKAAQQSPAVFPDLLPE